MGEERTRGEKRTIIKEATSASAQLKTGGPSKKSSWTDEEKRRGGGGGSKAGSGS